jgi:hypothetical protein
MGMERRLPCDGWFAPVRHPEDAGRCDQITIAGHSQHGRLQRPLISSLVLRRPERILQKPGRELEPEMQASLH